MIVSRLFLPLAATLLTTPLLATPLLATSVLAADSAKTGDSRYEALVNCRTITDNTARLACYDEKAADFAAAQKSGDVVVLDRKKIVEAKRQAFGLPGFDILKLVEHPGHAVEMASIEFRLASVKRTGQGGWIFVSEDGQVWNSIEHPDVFPEPKAGDMAKVTHGALGSFFLKAGDCDAVRVARSK